ncbi:MAG TPA: D-alanyl-D-alanine carboxypeptidase/D-alanyl-D-alanine-endopeptidase [Nocardioidaceae bacterium]|nr:D-alanyl-D-alanine carboxypeptidase/D-alanyl-D-alanine-endopeptidase [Nocardioidaceae bacterium]
MAGGDTRHSAAPSGRRFRRWTAALVAVVLVLAGLSFVFDLGPRWLGWDYPSPITEPAKVAPPPGLTLPSPAQAAAVAPASQERVADPAAVRRAVARLIRDKDLGPRVAVAVAQLSDGETVYETGPSSVTPASTMKMLTSAAALAALGPDHTFRTTVVAGASPRDVVIVGGGDPLLARSPDSDMYPARADIVTLAKATARSLKRLGRNRVRLGYDTSLFEGPPVSPAWKASYIPDDVVSPISALWVDEGLEPGGGSREADPAQAAAVEFAEVLKKQGIKIRGNPRPAVAAPDAEEYAFVQSAPLSQIVQWTLEVSDNETAEVLFRHVALAEGRPGSFVGGAAAVGDVLSRLGVDASADRIYDGSGLSRKNRLSPQTLLSVVEVSSSEEYPELRTVVSGLPVAGFTGSLAYRFEDGDEEGLGRVRAKTGTLTGVHGLAGVVTDKSGTVMAFVAIADRVKVADTLDARQRIDQVAAALAACACAATP